MKKRGNANADLKIPNTLILVVLAARINKVLFFLSIIIIPKFFKTFKNAVILSHRITALVIYKLEILKNFCYNIYREEKMRV